MHPSLESIAQETTGTRFEGDIYLVGGAVRDELLGLDSGSDFDIVTLADSAELAQHLFDRGVSTIPPVTYPRFGTAMVRVQGVNVEIVTARRESYESDSRKPHVVPASYLEDSQRRDFTVNTLQQNLFTGEILDRLGNGLDDLRDRILRTPLDPVSTFRDDPLRMLRAVRFRWKLEFSPADGLYQAIRSERDRLRIISFERIRDEFVKMLRLARASDCMRDLMNLGLFEHFAPEFSPMVGCEQGKFHHLDVWNHTLLVLDHIGHEDLLLSLAALFHDIGKPPTRQIDSNGDTRFFTHEVVGADLSVKILRRLKFSEQEVQTVAKLVKNHMRLGSATTFTPSAARRLVRDLGDQLSDLFLLVEADASSLRPGVKVLILDPIVKMVESVRLGDPSPKFESPIDGSRIAEITGIPEGRRIGELKKALTEAVLDGKLAADDIDGAEKLLRTIVQQ